MGKKEPSLLDEFRQIAEKRDRRCAVCFKVTKEAREVIEEGLRDGVGTVTIANFLRHKGLWQWTDQPLTTHKGHMK